MMMEPHTTIFTTLGYRHRIATRFRQNLAAQCDSPFVLTEITILYIAQEENYVEFSYMFVIDAKC